MVMLVLVFFGWVPCGFWFARCGRGANIWGPCWVPCWFHLSSVQNLLTIPVKSHSLRPNLPPCFRGLGFGFRGEMCDGWHFHGAFATIRLHGHPVMTLDMHRRFRGASANGLSIPTSARPSATAVSASAKASTLANLVLGLGGFDRCSSGFCCIFEHIRLAENRQPDVAFVFKGSVKVIGFPASRRA